MKTASRLSSKSLVLSYLQRSLQTERPAAHAVSVSSSMRHVKLLRLLSLPVTVLASTASSSLLTRHDLRKVVELVAETVVDASAEVVVVAEIAVDALVADAAVAADTLAVEIVGSH